MNCGVCSSWACRLRNLSIAGFIALTIFNILATVRLLHTTVCRRGNTQSNEEIASQMHTLLPRAPLIASSCLDYYIPDSGNINSTNQDRLPFQDVNLDIGRFDNKRLYKIFDHALVGDRFAELSQTFVVSVATQSSIERMSTIVDMASYWNGSISLATFVSGDDEFKILQIYVSYLRKCFRVIRDKVSFHLVFPKTRKPLKTVNLLKGDDFLNLDCAKPQDVLTSLLKMRSEETNKWRLKNVYPQNNLRNIARKGCQTKYVFAIDVDIVPSINFTEHIDKFLRSAVCNGLCAYVLPTFELDYRAKFPNDKSDVIRLRKKGLAVPFHHKIFIYNQFATNFSRWQASVNDEPVDTHISHNVTNYELYYEPFYIADDTVPPYDERFQGYGFTRNSQVYEMFMAGFQFQVISPLFTCHWGITRSRNRPAWRERQNYANHKLFDGFKREVFARYNKETLPIKVQPKQGNVKEKLEKKNTK